MDSGLHKQGMNNRVKVSHSLVSRNHLATVKRDRGSRGDEDGEMLLAPMDQLVSIG